MMANIEEYQKALDTLVSKVVEISHGIKAGDLIAHKTDMNLDQVYVVTDFVYSLGDNGQKEGIYVVGSRSAGGVHQDGVAFKLIEIQKVDTE